MGDSRRTVSLCTTVRGAYFVIAAAGRPVTGFRWHDRFVGTLREARVADGFRVDLSALEDAAAGVNRTLAELKAHKVSDLAGSEDDYGHDDLAETVADFCTRWELGIEEFINDHTGDSMPGLNRPTPQQVSQVLDKATPVRPPGQNAEEFVATVNGEKIRVIVNYDMPWRSTSYKIGQ